MTTAVVLTFGGTSASAFAQDDPASTTPTPTETVTTPTETVTPPPSSTEPAPPSTELPPSTEPAPPSSTEPAPTSQTPAPTQAPAQTVQPKQPERTKQPLATSDTKPDIVASARFQQPSYQSHESAWVSITVENKGTAVARGVRFVFPPMGLRVFPGSYGDLAWDGPGVDLAPGQSRFLEVYGTFGEIDNGKVTYSGMFTLAGEDADPGNNGFAAIVPVTQAYGTLSGRVFADSNGNGTYDQGEQIADGIVEISNGTSAGSRQTVTDREGLFHFATIPAGSYEAYYSLPNGWVVRNQGVRFFVQSNTTTNVTAVAERPWSDVLRASISLDKDQYRAGETAKMTVVVTNNGNSEIRGVQAGCNRIGDPNHLGLPLIGPGTGGFSVGAGETRTMTFDQIVPGAARDHGEVVVHCDFEPNAAYDASGPQAHDSAKVEGTVGRWSATLVHDKNGNGQLDQGEYAQSADFVLIDPATGRRVGAAQFGPRIELTNLPIARYRGEIGGDWKVASGGASIDVDPTETGSDRLIFVVPAQRDLAVDVRFSKQTYERGEPVKVTVSITNKGSATATRVYLQEPFYQDYLQQRALLDEPRWGDLNDYFHSPVVVRPGETRTIEFNAKPQGPVMRLEGSVGAQGSEANYFDNNFSARATVVGGQGNVSGLLYADRNDDGKRDAGEELPDVNVHVYSSDSSNFSKTATTDAAGRFEFRDLPAGVYSVYYSMPDGWLVVEPGLGFGERWTVADGSDQHFERRAVRPLGESLTAKLVLDKDAYAPGDRVGLTVTLTNTGSKDLTGIRAYCVYPLGNDVSWGDLRQNQSGVTIKAGATFTHTLTETAGRTGMEGDFDAACDFGNPALHPRMGFAKASDIARLLSGVGELKGTALQDPDGEWPYEGEGVEGVEIVVIDPFTGAEAARVKSGADGKFSLPGMPVGHYDLKVVGKYRLVNYRTPGEPVPDPAREFVYARVYADFVMDHTVPVELAPAPPVVDPVVDPVVRPDTSPRAPAAPPATPQVVLAKTGASVLGIGVLGGLLVAFGLGARAAGRRKTA